MTVRHGVDARFARRPVSDLMRVVQVGAVLWLLALSAPSVAATPQATPAGASEYVFTSSAGLLVFHVRPDHTSEFEAIVDRIGDALEASVDPIRRRQAASWRMFRSSEQTPGVVLYVFFFDPAESGADYDPVRVISEAAPLEAQQTYERLRAAVVKVERMGLARLR